jgi:hypothetical protein
MNDASTASVQRQRKIKATLKQSLIAEAGGKCANPGCSNWRAHIHHIRQWSVYKCHDAEHMIAVCPSCHDAIHNGKLCVTDETLYRWKQIERRKAPETAQIYVEPAPQPKLLLGSIAFLSKNSALIVFKLSDYNNLHIRILDGDILQVTSHLRNLKGKTIFRVVENHVRAAPDQEVNFEFRAGHTRITVPVTEDYIPHWVVRQMRVRDPSYATNGRATALDIEVMKPGLVKVQGIWTNDSSSIVITENLISFCNPWTLTPTSLAGEGESTLFYFDGPITTAVFGT